MFVRFRKTRSRLQISLAIARRVDGKATQEHVAALGSVGDPPSAYDRLEFWTALHERLGRLGNRIDGSQMVKVMAAVNERIPMVTPDEQRELKLATAEEDARLTESLLDMHAETLSGQKALIARAEASVSAGETQMLGLTNDLEQAKKRLERLRADGDAPGNIERPMTREEFMKAIGWTEADARHAKVVQQLYDLNAEEDATKAITDKRTTRTIYRRVLRERLKSG